MNAERFEYLLAALLDGSISAEEQRELLSAAAANPQFGHLMLELLRIESVLSDVIRQDCEGEGFLRRVQQRVEKAGDSARFAKAVIDKVREQAEQINAAKSGRMPASKSSSSSQRVSAATSGFRPIVAGDSSQRLRAVRSSRSRIQRTQKQSPVGALATAAVLALVVSGLIFSQRPVDTGNPTLAPAIATLQPLSGEVSILNGNDKAAEAKAESAVVSGQGVQTGANSRALLAYNDGTRIEILPQSRVTNLRDGALEEKSSDGKLIHLQQGELNASVAKQPAGRALVINTATARILVVGTRFALNSQSSATRLEVSEGAVKLTRNNDNKTVKVSAGQFIVAENSGELQVQMLASAGAAAPVSQAQLPAQPAEESAFTAASYLGGSGNDSVVSSEIQSDGSVVLAAQISNARPDGRNPVLLNSARNDTPGAIVRLSGTGRIVLSVTRLAETLNDVALDSRDNIYIAAGASGMLKLDAHAHKLLWKTAAKGACLRLDAAKDGTAAALFKDQAGGQRLSVWDGSGKLVSEFTAPFNTYDVAIDSASKKVFAIGETSAHNACLAAFSYDGTQVWHDYDSGNNPAPAKGLRVSLGRDKKLYAAFEATGANDVFVNAPQGGPAALIANDDYSSLKNAGNATLTFFGRYDPGNGELLAGQFLLGRNAKGYGTAVSIEDGEIKADEQGRIYLAGQAQAGLPLSADAAGQREFTAKHGFVLICSNDFQKRELLTTFNAAAGGSSILHTVASRNVPGQAHASVVCGGEFSSGGAWLRQPLQLAPAGGTDGYFAVRGVGQVQQ